MLTSNSSSFIPTSCNLNPWPAFMFKAHRHSRRCLTPLTSLLITKGYRPSEEVLTTILWHSFLYHGTSFIDLLSIAMSNLTQLVSSRWLYLTSTSALTVLINHSTTFQPFDHYYNLQEPSVSCFTIFSIDSTSIDLASSVQTYTIYHSMNTVNHGFSWRSHSVLPLLKTQRRDLFSPSTYKLVHRSYRDPYNHFCLCLHFSNNRLALSLSSAHKGNWICLQFQQDCLSYTGFNSHSPLLCAGTSCSLVHIHYTSTRATL